MSEEKLKRSLTDWAVEIGNTPKYEHTIRLFYSPTCPHCKQVEPQIEEYLEKHPKILFLKTDATTTGGTKMLRSLGLSEVPVVVVDNRFMIVGDINFYERLDYAVKMSKNFIQPPPLLLAQKIGVP